VLGGKRKMAVEDEQQQGETENSSESGEEQENNVDIDKLVADKVSEQLKDIKGKLDNAYAARDEALKKIADFEQEKRDAELKRMKDEGKEKEAYELQLAEEKAKREALERRNTELTRDIEVRNALGTHQFRSDKALEMAFKEIAGQLVKNESGSWVHKSGVSVKDFVQTFAEDENNAFLFRQKTSSGAGTPAARTNPSSNQQKSLFAMSQEEVIKMAREGKLPSM
jgi:hypothetical protein